MGALRLFLALSVVATHANSIFGVNFVGGQIAVQAFYIISGFYMTLILNEKYHNQKNSYSLFITNRFMRLYPVYWVVLVLTILVALGGFWIHGSSTRFTNFSEVNFNPFSWAYLIFSNLFLFGQDIIMFLGIKPDNGNLFFTTNFYNTNPRLYTFLFTPQAWTLGLELTFYLIAPFIVRKKIGFVLFVLCLSLLIRLYLYNWLGLKNDPWSYRFFPSELMFFLLGCISYKLYVAIKDAPSKKNVNIFVLVFIITFTTLYFYIPTFRINHTPFTLNEIVYFAVVVLSIPVLFIWLKNNRLDSKIGELSYPIYISHILIIVLSNLILINFLKEGWVIAIGSILLSVILVRFIIKPIERYRQLRVEKATNR
jgi:peptidoglycan/LPS O-acetylase OafA/YrhL